MAGSLIRTKTVQRNEKLHYPGEHDPAYETEQHIYPESTRLLCHGLPLNHIALIPSGFRAESTAMLTPEQITRIEPA